MANNTTTVPPIIKPLTECVGDELKGLRCAVTGGCGFLGCYLIKLALNAGAASVVAVDLRKSPLYTQMIGSDPRAEVFLCDVRSEKDLVQAFADIDVVFHSAGYFGNPPFSGKYGDVDRVFDINVNGTKAVVAASKANNIKTLIYTSSVNVVFDCVTPIENGDETLPYPAEHNDPYGASKAKAEQLIISMNGNGDMRTCALRPNGIYGPGDWVVSRSIKLVGAQGGVVVRLAEGQLSDFTFVENIAYANILAASKLVDPATAKVVGGQCYNITDGVASNSFEWMRDYFEACGIMYKPVMSMPRPIIWFVILIMELICYYILTPRFGIHPVMTSLEICKVYTTHYFSIKKAQRDLGYKPIPEKQSKEVTAKYYASFLRFDKTNWWTLRNVIIGLLFCVFLQFFVFSH